MKYIDVGRTLPSEYDAPHAGARIEIPPSVTPWM